jgi:hypothetical protein
MQTYLKRILNTISGVYTPEYNNGQNQTYRVVVRYKSYNYTMLSILAFGTKSCEIMSSGMSVHLSVCSLNVLSQ